MSGFFFVSLAALFASLSSIITAKTIRYQKESSGYFTFYFLISLLASLFINSLSFSKISFSLPISIIGGIAGILLITSMVLVGLGVQKGPSGLTFAFLNAGAIAPPLVLALVFSTPFGFSLNLANFIGMVFVIGGLFWAACNTKLSIGNKSWFLYAFFAFVTQAVILTIFQWRVLLFQEDAPAHKCLFLHCKAHEDFCFMPAMFLLAFLLQGFLFLYKQKRLPSIWEVIGGVGGGLLNGLATFVLLLATTYATAGEKAMLFPVFASLVILLCNCLERVLHREKVNWFALSLLAGGIFVGTFF